jgi:hypothetical protein
LFLDHGRPLNKNEVFNVLELSAEHAGKSTKHLIVSDLREAYLASPVSDRPGVLEPQRHRSTIFSYRRMTVSWHTLGTQMTTDAALAFGASTST